MKLSPLIFLASIISTFSCNGLFYQPSDQIFHTPKDLGIEFLPLTFMTADYQRISGWLLQSPVTPTKGTVIHFHGNGENMSSHFMYSSWLVDSGYQVVTFDYRGYGASEGVPSRAGTVEDGKAVIEAVCADPTNLHRPVFVLAQSLGGAVAIPSIALTSANDCVRGLVLDSTFASYRDLAQLKLASFWLTWPLQLPLSYLVSDELSPKDYINELKIPAIFIHSHSDPVVPFASGLDLYESYKDSRKVFWSLTDRSHTLAFSMEDGIFREKLVAWLDRF